MMIEHAATYTPTKLRQDLIAGLTVSVVEVPQAMAYAMLAGVPPQYGIFTSIIQGPIGALLSSSRHLRTGSTNTQSLLVASAVSRIVNPLGDPGAYLRLVIGLTLIKGLIQLLFAAARTGAMVRYVSRSVIVGLTSGAGVLIILSQVAHVAGLNVVGARPRFAGALGQLERITRHVGGAGGAPLVIAAISLVIMLAARRVSRFMPAALLAIAAGAGAVAGLGWTPRDIALVGELPRALPTFAFPRLSWGEVQSLAGGALALALVGMLESVAIAKSIGAAGFGDDAAGEGRGGERVSANREFFVQGLAGMASSFFQCIPGSGSYTRSALDHAAGAQTRLAGILCALFVAAIFFLAGGWAKFVPLASLGAVLIVIGWGLIDWRYVPRVWRASRSDALVCAMTFAAAMVLRLEIAIFVGIFLNLTLFLKTAGRLHLSEMVRPAAGPFVERPILDKQTRDKQVIFLQLEGDLFFAIADELRDRLSALVASGVRVVILRLKRTHSVDATALGVLEKFAADLAATDRQVILCGVKPELMTVLRSYGLIDRIGRENVFATSGGVFTSAKLALERARQLVGRSIDTLEIDAETDADADDRDEPEYSI